MRVLVFDTTKLISSVYEETLGKYNFETTKQKLIQICYKVGLVLPNNVFILVDNDAVPENEYIMNPYLTFICNLEYTFGFSIKSKNSWEECLITKEDSVQFVPTDLLK